MSVERRGKAWRVRYRDENGHNRSVTFPGTDKKARAAAEAFDHKVKLLKASGELHTLYETPPGIRTLEDYTLQVWWPDHAQATMSRDGLEFYARQLDKRIMPKWADTRLRDLRSGPIEAWATQMLREGSGEAVVRKTLTVMQSILSKAVRDEEIDRNPVDMVRKPKAARKRKPVAVTPLHVERMREHMLDPTRRVDGNGRPHVRRVEHLRHLDATLLSLLAYSGPRPESEALPTRWEQVGEKTVTYYASGKRGAKERQTRLLKALATDLKHWRLRSPASAPDDLIFGEWSHENWKYWREDIFKPAAHAAGLPEHVVPRDLRGSFESLLIWSGEDVIRVAREIGHSAKECLDTYGRVFAELDATNRRPLEDVIADARAEVWGLRDVG